MRRPSKRVMLCCGAGRIDVACDMISFLVLLLREEQKIRIKKGKKSDHKTPSWVAFFLSYPKPRPRLCVTLANSPCGVCLDPAIKR